MKTYFNYESIIKSKDAGEAIAAPLGVGAFCGFSYHRVSNNSLTLYSRPDSSKNPFYNDNLNRIVSRYLTKNSDDGEAPDVCFGCISRDGYVFVSDEVQMTIGTISGSKGSNNDILVFAVHQEVKEPIDNPVTFVAYWSASSESFYTLYKQSLNPYYPTPEDQITWDIINNNPKDNSQLNTEYLLSLVEGACPDYKNNKDSMVLIGIYGSGNDASNNGANEDYALVPYQSIFPAPLEYNTAYQGLYEKTLSHIEKTTQGFLSQDTEGTTLNIKDYIDQELKKIRQEFSTAVSVPSGVIAMWSGSGDAPKGWEYCDGNAGRPNLLGKFIVGRNAGDTDYNTIGKTGGNKQVTLSSNNIPSHKHNLKMGASGAKSDGSGSIHFVDWIGERNILGEGDRRDGKDDRTGYTEENQGGSTPIDIRPPYYVLAYIIKVDEE